MRTTYEAMMSAISIIKNGKTVGDIGNTIENYVTNKGFSVVKE